MHIQIVTFRLNELDDETFRRWCEAQAPAFARVPGLLAKVWLADPATNTYGGVFTWRDRQAMNEFLDSALLRAVATNPHLVDLTTRDFGVLDGPTRITRGLAAAAA